MKTLPERQRIRLPREAYGRGNAFSITIAAWQRYPWFQIYPELAGIAAQTIRQISKERGQIPFAWCLMPDHLQLLVTDRDLVNHVRIRKGRLTPAARKMERGLRKEEQLEAAARYIWENGEGFIPSRTRRTVSDRFYQSVFLAYQQKTRSETERAATSGPRCHGSRGSPVSANWTGCTWAGRWFR